MHVFILILFLNASGETQAYATGYAPDLAACHKLIEAKLAAPDPASNGLRAEPFCIDTTKLMDKTPVPEKKKPKVEQAWGIET